MADFRDVIYHESCSRRIENNSHVDAAVQVHIPRNDCRDWAMVALVWHPSRLGGFSVRRPRLQAQTTSTPHNPGAI